MAPTPESKAPSPPANGVVNASILRAFRFLFVATVVLYVGLATTTLYLYVRSTNSRAQIAQVAQQTLEVQCASKAQLEGQRDDSTQYLQQVQSGKRKRIAGISDNDIRLSLTRITTALHSYKGLQCDPKEAP